MDPYQVTPELVKHIAALASLDLTPKEEMQFSKELNRILDHIKHLQSINTEEVEPVFHTSWTLNRLRKDEENPSLPPSMILRNAPEREGNLFKIPPVLEMTSKGDDSEAFSEEDKTSNGL
jgi:aspartyl-tRNA(Asn)/glutamyl-tRNA(Gln) amidotransferase subunit C